MLSRRTWLGVAVVASLLLVGHILGYCGPEGGTEFSPDTFRTRSYTAYRWGPFQFPRFDGVARESSLSRYLVAHGHLERNPEKIRWVAFYKPPTLSFLFCYFGETSSRTMNELEMQLDWPIAWSDRDPELAKRFWRQIVKWVQNDRYDEVLQLLQYDQEPKSMEELEGRFEECERKVREWNELFRS